jgi:hypothetical protein
VGGDVVLGPDETVAGRPFTDPAHTGRDEAALRRLLEHERERARPWLDDPFGCPRDVLVRETDVEGRRHLLVVPDAQALLDAPCPTVVGFFGRPREDADAGLLFELEEELVTAMGAYAAHGLLSYYDIELVKGRYGNLILFAGPDGPKRWGEDPVHRRAVEISPSNYHEIRLHRGTLSRPLLEPGELRLTQTRYLHYEGSEVWRAVRSFADGQ